MEFARAGFDIGLFSNAREPQLDFWQKTVGLAYDHMGKLGGGVQQHRHHLHDAILKMNHARDPLPAMPPTGYAELIVAVEGRPGTHSETDPDGNRVTLAPAGKDGIDGYALKLSANDPEATMRFYRDVIGLEQLGDPKVFRHGKGRILIQPGEVRVIDDADWRGPGFRYITFQVMDAKTAFQEAEAKGASIGAPLRELGDVVRFGFLRDPDGNMIEISERTTFTGKAL
ncbi:VOC family protein [Minwuia thermotolerans]|nr:VOC family protein [Minwuia thermotolerans]